MKKLFLLSLVAGLFCLTSCDTTREITIGKDGSGSVVTSMDMSQLIGVAKMSGQAKDMENQKAIDTTISFAAIADSMQNIGPDEKELVKKGNMNMAIDVQNDKFVTTLSFPFSKIDDLPKLDKISGKMTQEAMKKQMAQQGGAPQGMPEDAMPQGSVDDYFITSYSDGVIERKLNKEKYATVGEDKGMQALKEVGDQGMPINSKIVINLPRPAKKVTGVNATLSEDKKKVTVNSGMDDFFADATKLEFKIEY